MPYHLNPPPQGPVARIIASIVAAFALLATIMLGMVAFLVIAGLALVAGIAIWLRVAWIKRQLKKNGVNMHNEARRHDPSGHVIDAEYTVVDSSDEQEDAGDQNRR